MAGDGKAATHEDGGGTALAITSVTEVVYAHLRQQVLAGMSPGTPLRLSALAADLGVSTTPVRMALERLAGDGLVRQAGRRGATVAPLSLPDFEDIYTVRRSLEGAAARLGAARLGKPEDDLLTSLLHHLRRFGAARAPEVDEYLRVEWSMHQVCYEAAGHPRLLEEIRSYRRLAERYFRLALAEGMNFLDDLQHQLDFCDACLRHDPKAAECLAVQLLDWTVERVAPILTDSPSFAQQRLRG